MRNYYAEYLRTKNLVNTLESEVSKVSKGLDITPKQAFDTFDTSSSRAYQKNIAAKNTTMKCSNCDLEMNLIENNTMWFCPIGCESRPIQTEA